MKDQMNTREVFLLGVVTTALQFGTAIIAFGGLQAFGQHAALLALAVVTLALLAAVPFTSGNLSSGNTEDRGNRWVFTAFGILALASAVVPAYTDRIGLWTMDNEAIRWIGVLIYALGGGLRLWPVFVLGRRFSGLVAIQPEHTLETRGIYGTIRNPSYLGMLVMIVGWGFAFRGCWGLVIAALLLLPLVARIKAEERLLRHEFGAEYEQYVARTWRLVPGIY